MHSKLYLALGSMSMVFAASGIIGIATLAFGHWSFNLQLFILVAVAVVFASSAAFGVWALTVAFVAFTEQVESRLEDL